MSPHPNRVHMTKSGHRDRAPERPHGAPSSLLSLLPPGLTSRLLPLSWPRASCRRGQSLLREEVPGWNQSGQPLQGVTSVPSPVVPPTGPGTSSGDPGPGVCGSSRLELWPLVSPLLS